MKEIMNEFVEAQLEQFIDINVSKKIMQDEIYLKDIQDAEEIQNRFEKIDLTIEQKRMIGDYIACMNSAYTRIRDIAYLKGIEDAMLLLESANS